MKKRKLLTAIALLLAVVCVPLGLQSCANMGARPSVEDTQRYARSPQFDVKAQRFVNHNQDEIDGMKDRVFNLRTVVTQLRIRQDLTPEEKLPEVEVDFEAFLDDTRAPNIVWLGHSSFMLRMAEKTLLIDPVFGNAGPLPFLGGRFQDSVLAREDLPEIDAILISHDHYDHLEADTVRYFATRKTQFIVPIGIGGHLQAWGIEKTRIRETDWWQETRLDELLIATLPAQHYSGRRGFLANDTLWASFVLKGPKAKLYFSGDSGYGPHFAKIGREYGPFDAAFLENGQYNVVSRAIHAFPEDNIRAVRDLNAKVLVPIHWGMFQLARHPWYEPAERITRLAKENDVALVVPKMGEQIPLDAPLTPTNWWSPLMQRQQKSP